MWRLPVVLLLIGLLLVSAGGVALALKVSAVEADMTRLRSRAEAAESAQASLQSQLDQLKAQATQTAPGPAATSAPGATRSAPGATTSAPGTGTSAPATGATGKTGASGKPGLTSPAAVPTPTLSPALAAVGIDGPALQHIEAEVAGLRGLSPRADVPIKFLDQQSLEQYLDSNFQNNYLPIERETDQKLMASLGLLNQGDSVADLLLGVLNEQVEGAYNEDDKTLYLVQDPNAQLLPQAQATFAAEFTHALQDQYFDLNALSPKHPQNDDRALAIQALVEGDATLLQRQWVQQMLSPQAISELDKSSTDTKLNAEPLYMREQLLFPYTDGFDFVQQAYQNHGGYPGVDAVFLNPPDSTQQILHPDKYWSHVEPIDVKLPDLSPALGGGWRMINTNVLGELDIRLILEQLTDSTRAVQGSSGWAGDHWELLDQNGRQALVLATVWDSESSAQAFFDAFGLALSNRFGGAQVDDSSPTHQALTASTAATDMRLSGRNVEVVISFDRASCNALVAALGTPIIQTVQPTPTAS